MPLLIASQNRHKLEEIRAGLRLPALTLLGLADLAQPPDVTEDGATFADNARKKATILCRFSGLWTLADDSGLEVDALDGAPGVQSARFAGVHGDDDANNALVLRLLVRHENRRARFRCVLALCAPDGVCRTVEGVCEGTLAREPRGENGFGYDPLFIPDGSRRTFGQLSPRTKRRLSHRAQALRAALSEWNGLLKTGIG